MDTPSNVLWRGSTLPCTVITVPMFEDRLELRLLPDQMQMSVPANIEPERLGAELGEQFYAYMHEQGTDCLGILGSIRPQGSALRLTIDQMWTRGAKPAEGTTVDLDWKLNFAATSDAIFSIDIFRGRVDWHRNVLSVEPWMVAILDAAANRMWELALRGMEAHLQITISAGVDNDNQA